MKRPIAFLLALLLALALALTGCGAGKDPSSAATSTSTEPEELGPTVTVGGQLVPVDESLALSQLTAEDFVWDEDTGRVTCLSWDTLTGVDVSSHQGEIDWAAVAGDDIDFAMLRIGNRGYSQGALRQDERFEDNWTGAVDNGLEVGVYFFSQAISEEEAIEEADFVLSILNGRSLDLPVVFDWEQIVEDTARTDEATPQTVTACAVAFCNRIEEAGYQAAFYCNGMVGYLFYDLAQLSDFYAWYAEYADWPSFAYAFDLWQYTTTASVAGISGSVDLNLWFAPEGDEDAGE